MKKAEGVIILWWLLFFTLHAEGTSYSLPGKPTLTNCRSPEKETFTCWWEPGSDGGLPTTYHLYYRKESSDAVHECPDYRTAGKNSCFFNKNDTSIWINYNITVVATNARGSTFSDPVEIDVVYIVKPNPPEKVTANVSWNKSWPSLRVSWDPPQKADTRSGWITLIYELRIKLEGEDKWEEHPAGQQKMYNIYSLQSGGTYLVQVRCRPDHGFWSEWSDSTYFKVPDYFPQERSIWIIIMIFSVFIFLILIWAIHMNSHTLKHHILPPVPGPKIKGFDKQLLKSGKSRDAFSSLVGSDFPPTTTNYEDLLVEYLEVYIPEEQGLMLEEGKDLHDGSLKSKSYTSDSDSGRGSCDSHALLVDKSEEEKEVGQKSNQQGGRTEMDLKRPEESPEENILNYSHANVGSPDVSCEKVKTWPSLFSPLTENSSGPLDQPDSPEMAKQHCLSDSLFPPSPLSSPFAPPGHKEVLGSNYQEYSFGNLHPQTGSHQYLRAHGNMNVANIGHKGVPADLQLPPVRSTEYVEVQKVNNENMVLLYRVSSDVEKGCPGRRHTEEYSRLKGVNNDNGLLLLQRMVSEEEMNICPYEDQESSGLTDSGYTTSTAQKSTAYIPPATQVLDERVAGGYVDTSMFTLPIY
ncbi:prolactin receptor precursor [Kryptolebias marmoratus]|uniref:Prolactin receptor n=1 Tax=Kryptolebias marmoratus TaxID=37003 RepID=E9JPY0_KRYMA|nr:prolactin receptor a precursor [Kryptolebias marmoratus]ADB65774.1 prolactin receptor 1 [Kryptolebias marmoratus]